MDAPGTNSEYEIPDNLPIHTAETTYRTYKDYLDYFALDPEQLKGKQILDEGAGMATFVSEIGQRFADSGTTCVALDPAYAALPAITTDTDPKLAYDQFNTALHKGTLVAGFLTYHGEDGKELNEQEQDKIMGERLLQMRQEALSSKDISYVAGVGSSIPYPGESFDFIVSSNYLLMNGLEQVSVSSAQGRQTILEAARVLKPHGEMRIQNAAGLVFRQDEETGRVSVELPSTAPYMYREVDNERLKGYQILEGTGLRFYRVHVPHVHGEKYGASFLLIRKDDELPTGFVGEKAEVYKLNFSRHTGAVAEIPSELLEVAVTKPNNL